ncbi:YnfA family protein [Helicobacter sp. MIT 99-5507]|uniref:YnfA family protein n=1 Tax=Helicobacter sp. MIT 99-5507 TaxID=152489 RepID=UPI000E1EFF80|nr:YnfA family protein [Helicobacter sp. MIT 99-5507]RDU58233.1 hypothetical protein CQA42_00025 [Helicobacter sp. MIT 99-5507]
MLRDIFIFFVAAFFEILGCFSFWLVFKANKTYLWLILGIICVIIFAYLLTKVELAFAGRAYAIYGGIYIASSLLWLYIIEKQSLTYYDILGSLCVFIGVCIILFGAKNI